MSQGTPGRHEACLRWHEAAQWSLYLSSLHLWPRPSLPGMSEAVFGALSESAQGKTCSHQGQLWSLTLGSHGNVLVLNTKEAILMRGEVWRYRARDVTCPSQVGDAVSTCKREAGGLCAPCCSPHPHSQLQEAALLTPRTEARLGLGAWEVSHSRTLKWNFEPSLAAGLSSVSCPDKTGRVWASFILKDEI